jgi:cellulose synthase/poly-beta-1,6-N-acetylglucosamine synthase-like glycosyltransferase
MKVVHGSGLEAEQMNVTYRRWIRHRQSLVHSSIGADGANWALRRKFVQFPERQLAEDLVIPLEVIHAGYRFLYEPLGGAVETSPLSVHDEYHRKVRTIAGGIQAALYCRWMFTPRFAATGFHFVSWKLSKYAVPGWAIMGYVTALTIPALSQVALLMGMATVGFALTAGTLKNTNRGILKWMVTPWYCLVAAATPFAAVTMLLRRRGNLKWRMAAR